MPERPPKMFITSPNKQRNTSIEENSTTYSKQHGLTSERSVIKIRLENSEDKVNDKISFLTNKVFFSPANCAIPRTGSSSRHVVTKFSLERNYVVYV